MKTVIRIAAIGTYLTDTSPLSSQLVKIEPRPMAMVKVATMRVGDRFTGDEILARKGRDLGQEDDAQEPEPGNAEDGQEHVLAVASPGG